MITRPASITDRRSIQFFWVIDGSGALDKHPIPKAVEILYQLR